MSIQVVADVLEHSELTNKLRLIQIVLANYADENKACWPSIQTILHETRISSERTLYRQLDALKQTNECAIVKHGSKIYPRATQMGNRAWRNNLYFVLTNMETDRRNMIKLWANQQDWIVYHSGENSAILTPFTEESIEETYSLVNDAIPVILDEINKGNPDIFISNPDIAVSVNPLKINPLTKYITINFLKTLNMINY